LVGFSLSPYLILQQKSTSSAFEIKKCKQQKEKGEKKSIEILPTSSRSSRRGPTAV
jgi:hypothetical protein